MVSAAAHPHCGPCRVEGDSSQKCAIVGGVPQAAAISHTANKRCSVQVSACALPASLVETLQGHQDALRAKANSEEQCGREQLHSVLHAAFSKCGEQWATRLEQLWALGPHGCGPNLLVNEVMLAREGEAAERWWSQPPSRPPAVGSSGPHPPSADSHHPTDTTAAHTTATQAASQPDPAPAASPGGGELISRGRLY